MKQLQVDIDKLYAIFKKRGLYSTYVAKEIGVNASYFSNVKARGTLSELVATSLEVKYNIPRAEYLSQVEKESTKTENILTQKDKVVLYELIYSAVYNAMKKVLNE